MSNQGQRSFHSALAPENLQSIQRGTHNFMWKGCKMWKGSPQKTEKIVR